MKHLKLPLLLSLVLLAGSAWGTPFTGLYDALTGAPDDWGDRDESGKDRANRMAHVTNAILFVTKQQDEQAALVATAHSETLLARRIGEDRCEQGPPGQRCDPDKHGKAQARGYWQLHRSACPEAWAMEPSSRRLRVEAACALRALRLARKRCGDWPSAIAGYTGSCDAPDKVFRARSYRTFFDVVMHGWPKPPKGWVYASGVTSRERRSVLHLLNAEVHSWHLVRDDLAVLVDWHWHDPSGDKSPKGWHKGLSFFQPEVKR